MVSLYFQMINRNMIFIGVLVLSSLAGCNQSIFDSRSQGQLKDAADTDAVMVISDAALVDAAIHDGAVLDAALPSPACMLRQGGLAWWRGEGDASDSSNSSTPHPGVANLAVEYSAGKAGNAFNFVGGNGRVEISDESETFLPSGDFSVELWMKASDQSAGIEYLISKNVCGGQVGCVANGMASWWRLRLDNAGFLRFGIKNEILTASSDSATVVVQNTGNASFRDSLFHHIVIVRDTVTAKIQIYVDGTLRDTKSLTSVVNGPFQNNDNEHDPLYIGMLSGFDGVAGNFFKGLIDEVAYYNDALTPAHVTTLYENTCVP